MIKKSYILNFFFCVAMLTLLTACGGGGAADDGVDENDGTICDSNPNLPICERPDTVTCNPLLFDCTVNPPERLPCDDTTTDCTTGFPIFDPTCDPVTHFCDTTQALRSACAPATHNCNTGVPLTVTSGSGGGAPAKFPIVNTTGDNDLSRYVTVPTYTPSDAPPSGFTSWEGAGGAATMQRTAEYLNNGNADRIGAAYAHARGYTGAGSIVSIIGGPIDREYFEYVGQLVTGYTLHGDDSTSIDAGTCVKAPSAAFTCSTSPSDDAAIIVARQDRTGTQGIAYGAKIKPISTAFFDDKFNNIAVDLNNVIRHGSGEGITVMREDADYGEETTYIVGSTIYYYKTFSNLDASALPSRDRATFNNIINSEREAYKEAVKTTVMVIPQGNYGHNGENGMVSLYSNSIFNFNDYVEDRAWAIVDASNGVRNLGTITARLPLAVPELQGKWLTVIALDENNRILPASNGCGDTKNFCLGAPGRIYYNQTDYAATHVAAAVAVVASSFPTGTPATPEQLVAIILNTADDLGVPGTDNIYGRGALNLARAVDPIGRRMTATASGASVGADASIDNSGITLPTSFGGALDGFTVGFIDDYKRAYIGNPARISRTNAAFTLGDTIATWESPELQSIALDSNSKMQFTNYDESADAKDTLIFTHSLPNHTVAFSYNEKSKRPDLQLADNGEELHFQKIRPIASDLMQLNSTYKLGKAWNVKNALTSGEFDTGNKFNEAMANLNYTGENSHLTIGAGTLKEYGQFLGASGTGAYQLSDATSSQVTHLAISQNLPRNSTVKVKYTNFKTETDMRYDNFAKINDLTADEYQLSLSKRKILGKNDSLNLELIQPFAVTDGNLQQNTVLGYNDAGDYNNVTQNYTLAPTNRRQQLRMTWQNQLNNLKTKTKLFISMQYENHVNNLRDNNDSQILGGISTRF